MVEREKYVLEGRNDRSANPDIQIFDFYEKIWRKEEAEEDKQRKEEKEKNTKMNKRRRARGRNTKKKRKHAAEEIVKERERMKEKMQTVKTAKTIIYNETKTKNTK
jgi:hypothetical protein